MSERRAYVYVVVLVVLFLIFSLSAIIGRDYSERGVNAQRWIAKNEDLLDSLPVYPGAVEERVSSSVGNPFPNAKPNAAEEGPFKSFSTTRSYSLPAGTTSDLVLSFYREQLTGWTADIAQVSSCANVFRRDQAKLDVDTCDDKLELVVNYKQLE